MPDPATASTAAGKPRKRLSLVMLPVAIFGGLAVIFALALTSGDPSKLPSTLIGKPAPAVELAAVPELVDDKGAPLAGFRTADLATGKPAIVNFWASWCVPCVQEHPMLVELAKREGITLFGVNYKDQAVAARRFLGRYGNPFKAVGQDANGRAAIEWGVYGMPETFVVDGQGRIVFKHVGPITPESLQSQMIPAIERAKKG